MRLGPINRNMGGESLPKPPRKRDRIVLELRVNWRSRTPYKLECVSERDHIAGATFNLDSLGLVLSRIRSFPSDTPVKAFGTHYVYNFVAGTITDAVAGIWEPPK